MYLNTLNLGMEFASVEEDRRVNMCIQRELMTKNKQIQLK
jgi:hypothetical protein